LYVLSFVVGRLSFVVGRLSSIVGRLSLILTGAVVAEVPDGSVAFDEPSDEVESLVELDAWPEFAEALLWEPPESEPEGGGGEEDLSALGKSIGLRACMWRGLDG
jgi:hypothetical protein